ncbi:hypothetical protein AAF712_014852 [Marasmius tenuissimus]|uniref:DUF6589 domain-containing protein n=1 Tax=Marasmius tenuissimus TaxID=585030 RepID=A0ABR2ZA65_9AGAR
MSFQRRKAPKDERAFEGSGWTRLHESKRKAESTKSGHSDEVRGTRASAISQLISPLKGVARRLRKKPRVSYAEADPYLRSSEPPPDIDSGDPQSATPAQKSSPSIAGPHTMPYSPKSRHSAPPETPSRHTQKSRYRDYIQDHSFEASELLQSAVSHIPTLPSTPARPRSTTLAPLATTSMLPSDSPDTIVEDSPRTIRRNSQMIHCFVPEVSFPPELTPGLATGTSTQDQEDQKQAEIAHQVFSLLTVPEERGGFGFKTPRQFFDNHGADIAAKIFNRSEGSWEKFCKGYLSEVVQQEGLRLQKILTRAKATKMGDLISHFSLQQLEADFEEAAPTLWAVLQGCVATKERTTDNKKVDEMEESGKKGKGRAEGYGKSEKEKDRDAILATICSMLAAVRLQKANNFQVVMGLFLLASGASKREIDVLSHAGLCVSYTSILHHVKLLSQENMAKIQKVVKEYLIGIIWDNVNFAFRVESQCLDSKDRFDNGTTATIVIQHDPFTNQPAQQGSLPLSLKPPRNTTHQEISNHSTLVLPTPKHAIQLDQCLQWLLKKLMVDSSDELAWFAGVIGQMPTISDYDRITPHQTTQFPLHAMHIDELTIDGTAQVYESILDSLNLTGRDLKHHGCLFVDGDLLTDSLDDKNESAHRNSEDVLEGWKAVVRRFGLFHAKMAVCHMVINEHWGKQGSRWPGTLWWEHTQLLKRKPITAGWQSKKAAPWKQSHELIQMSITTHVLDGFCLHCGSSDVKKWCCTVSLSEFNRVSNLVYVNLFSSTGYIKQSQADGEKDILLINNILYNCDALLYWLLVVAIKSGNIGQVVLVLRISMVMMRTPKTMPQYANAIFETLGRLHEFPERLR